MVMAMRHEFSGMRFKRPQDAMIRNREPRHHRQHDEEKPENRCGLATHDHIRSTRMPKCSNVFYITNGLRRCSRHDAVRLGPRGLD